MKRIFLAIALIAIVTTGFAQVGIGTATPNASSVLDLTSTSKAFLPPRLTTSQRDSIVNPVAGMVIYNNTTGCIEVYRGTNWFNICTQSSSGSLAAIDGYNSSNQVASANLIAYWPFDGNSKDSISSVSGTTISGGTAPTYANGKIGAGITFAKSGLIYNPIPALDSVNKLQRYTFSMWVNIPPNNIVDYPSGAEMSLFQVNGDWYNDIWGLASVVVHTATAAPSYTGDTLALGAELTQIDGSGPHTNDSVNLSPRTSPSQYFGGASKWSFITETYDDATDSVKLYGNGVLLLSRKIYILPNISTGETFTLNPNFGVASPYAHNQVTFGSFMFQDDFGASNTYTTGHPYPYGPLASARTSYTHGISGSLDDVRVFNRVLTLQEISDLYQLGNQGR
jgi:hypothetical protein